ncbi:MAG: LamG domain-containing protein [Bryobacteraceae bacterium]
MTRCIVRTCIAVVCFFFCLGRSQAQFCITPPSGMAAWYSGDGNANDLLGVNHGALQNGATFAPGKVGLAFSLNGNNQFVTLPANLLSYPARGSNSSAPLSADAWFQTSAGGVILAQQGDNAPPLMPNGWIPAIYVGTDGILYAELFWGGSVAPISSAPRRVNDGAFHHVAVTYDGASERLYLDGVLIASMPLTQTGYAASYQYQIGAGFTLDWPSGNSGYLYFRGLIDEVEFFNRALSDGEVQAIFNAGSAGKCKHLPPVAKCRNVTVTAGPTGTANASIDDGSFSPIPGNTITLTQAPPGPYSLGNTPVTLTATDNHGAASQCTGTVTVIAAAAPCGSLAATPNVLWPPNNQLVPVTVNVGNSNGCPAASCKIVSVRSSERDRDEEDDRPDWVLTGDLTVNLRATRAGGDSGRVYTVTVRCVDASGAVSTNAVTVTVPHDQRKSDDDRDDQDDERRDSRNRDQNKP